MTERAAVRKRVALVTGAGQGLGAEVVRQLADQGCLVLATHRRLCASIEAAPDVVHVEMDVIDEMQVRDTVAEAVSRFGGIDILVNNAGLYLDREEAPGPELLPMSLLKATLDVNLVGAACVMAEVIPVMARQRSGVIVNVSSGMGRNVELAGDAIYYRTSKAALTALSRCAAKRLEKHGIAVNAVCPGWVRTRMGGPDAVRSVERGAEGIVAAALQPPKSGALLRDTEDFGW